MHICTLKPQMKTHKHVIFFASWKTFTNKQAIASENLAQICSCVKWKYTQQQLQSKGCFT